MDGKLDGALDNEENARGRLYFRVLSDAMLALFYELAGGHNKDHSTTSSSSSQYAKENIDFCETSFVCEGGQERRQIRLGCATTLRPYHLFCTSRPWTTAISLE